MTTYLYPQNLKATANLWLWGLRDFAILCIATLLSVLALVQLGFFVPAAVTLCFGFLSIRMDDTTVLDFSGMRYVTLFLPSNTLNGGDPCGEEGKRNPPEKEKRALHPGTSRHQNLYQVWACGGEI